ncbi:MAG TPA: ATP-binding protein [Candidatus Saccharimonadales bacterium]|nr:ATP-binding protein [Candidatus Saccharimonadales bacterium]
MDYQQGLRIQIRAYLIFVILIENLLLIAALWFVATHYHELPLIDLAFGAYGVSVVMTFIIAFAAADYAMEPLRALWQIIVHIAPGEQQVAAPDLSKLVVGRVLVTQLAAQIYQIASVAEKAAGTELKQSNSLKANFVANNLPLPFFVLGSDQTILFANQAACAYIGREPDNVTGQHINSVLNMSFPSEQTLSAWLEQAKASAVTATSSWERVRLNVTDNQPTRLFDLAAYYNKSNTQGYETMLVLFDHTKQYSQDDQAISFIALAVHELRTPIALLRGYVEAFEEETRGTLSSELADFMSKMQATTQQLTMFINTILNVARVDNDQLVLRLHEENWAAILKSTIDMMSLRARVRGITLTLDVADDLPTVGADRASIQEVISNLIDNAIKYSAQSKEIAVKSYRNSEGFVETTVQDWGVGVPTAVIPNLFTKFYRDHRNRAQIGGTGLGLYLCKAVIGAHGGNIWVKSKEGAGSTFGFTLLPYSRLAAEAKTTDNEEIVRSPHGWIKNHSLYRR